MHPTLPFVLYFLHFERTLVFAKLGLKYRRVQEAAPKSALKVSEPRSKIMIHESLLKCPLSLRSVT